MCTEHVVLPPAKCRTKGTRSKQHRLSQFRLLQQPNRLSLTFFDKIQNQTMVKI